ncbi:MAG: hypothetical protein ACOCYX_05210 [Spirochaetota bacterium]
MPAFVRPAEPVSSARRKARCGRRLLTGSIVAAVFLAGCATAPVEPPPAPESLLLTDYSTWFAADIEGNRELLSWLFDELDADLGGVVDRTARLVGGVRLAPGSPAELSAVAAGAFPRGGVRFALTTSRDFERETAQVDGRRRIYFRDRAGSLQLALPRSDYLYLSTGRVLEMLQDRPPAELDLRPEVYESMRAVGSEEGPDALVLFNDPGAGLLESLGVQARGLPLRAISLSITNRSGAAAGAAVGVADRPADLELGGTLELRSERDAALFGRIGRLFVIVFVRALGLDSEAVQQAAVIEVDESSVVFAGIPMSRAELAGAILRVTGAP